jgi:hypothetical protein
MNGAFLGLGRSRGRELVEIGIVVGECPVAYVYVLGQGAFVFMIFGARMCLCICGIGARVPM